VSNQEFAYKYDVHGVIRIASNHRLPELGYFGVDALDAPADILVMTSTLAPLPGTFKNSPSRRSIRYNDGLGRIGFDIRIDYRAAIEVTVSALIAISPHVLYTNVLEPVLRWAFVQRGYCLIHAACLSFDGKAVLVTAKTDTGKTSTIILTAKNTPGCQSSSTGT